MKKQFLTFLAFCLTGCFGQNDTKTQPISQVLGKVEYVWTKLLDSAPWQKSYNFQMLSHKDTLWTFHPDGNWYATNGINWTKSRLPNAIYNLAFLDYIQFKDAVYGLGHFVGNIERFTLKSEIYKTTNFKEWVTLSKTSNLPKRFFYHPFVFDNKIWIIGGEDKNTQYADIWNSTDGVIWVKIKDNLPFGKRSRSQIVSLNNKLYLIDSDVWSSTDGLNWQKVTDAMVKGQEIYGTAIVYDNKIWLLGCNRNGKFSSGVLYSSDGKTWTVQEAPWTPRCRIYTELWNSKT